MTGSDQSTRFGEVTRRTALGSAAAAGAAAFGLPRALAADPAVSIEPPYELPPLPYARDALEPAIDARTVELHHDEHHQGYVDGANAAVERLAEMRGGDDPDGSLDGDDRIKAVERDLSFNLSGHALHSVYWDVMAPDGGGDPCGDVAAAIERDFGSAAAFREQFSAAAENVEGPGWALLCYEPKRDRLLITQTEKHNDLVVQGAVPILALDVWEHAYYLQYENDRGAYADAWWDVVDWPAVSERYRRAADGPLLPN